MTTSVVLANPHERTRRGFRFLWSNQKVARALRSCQDRLSSSGNFVLPLPNNSRISSIFVSGIQVSGRGTGLRKGRLSDSATPILHRGQTSEHSNKNKLRRQTWTLHRVLSTSNFFGKRQNKKYIYSWISLSRTRLPRTPRYLELFFVPLECSR